MSVLVNPDDERGAVIYLSAGYGGLWPPTGTADREVIVDAGLDEESEVHEDPVVE